MLDGVGVIVSTRTRVGVGVDVFVGVRDGTLVLVGTGVLDGTGVVDGVSVVVGVSVIVGRDVGAGVSFATSIINAVINEHMQKLNNRIINKNIENAFFAKLSCLNLLYIIPRQLDKILLSMFLVNYHQFYRWLVGRAYHRLVESARSLILSAALRSA